MQNTLLGGSYEDLDLKFDLLANQIKHNNNMLFAYALSNSNVNEYTQSMHGGATLNFGNVGDLPTTDYKGFIDTSEENPLEKDMPTLINIINSLLAVLKQKNRTLSDNSQKKVQTVVDGLITAENEVNELVARINAEARYSAKSDTLQPTDIVDAANNYVNTANFDAYNKAIAEKAKLLQDAIARKNKYELNGLSIVNAFCTHLKTLAGL